MLLEENWIKKKKLTLATTLQVWYEVQNVLKAKHFYTGENFRRVQHALEKSVSVHWQVTLTY